MIERARSLAAGAGEFLVADSEALPFSDASFTAVLCTASFHHYPQPERALAEMARVLAPHLFDGGYAIIRARPR